MIGQLPVSLTVDDVEYPICSDFRPALAILQAFADPELPDRDKNTVMLDILFECLPDNLHEADIREAVQQAHWFLNCGSVPEQRSAPPLRLMDWEQDEQVIFAGIAPVAGHDVRLDTYCHWWTFMGYYMAIGESVFSTIVSIRKKQLLGKKLESWEQDFYRDNPQLINFKTQRGETDALLEWLRGG